MFNFSVHNVILYLLGVMSNKLVNEECSVETFECLIVTVKCKMATIPD